MSLQLKTICSWKLDGIPGVNNIFNKISKWNIFANEQIKQNSLIDTNYPVLETNNLNIICIQGLYGYRTGLIGNISNIIAKYLSIYSNPIYLQSIIKLFCKTDANDFELISFAISIISRLIPINNIYTFDIKDSLNINTLVYKNGNKSS